MKRFIIVLVLTLLPFTVSLKAELPDTLWQHCIQKIDTLKCFVLQPNEDISGQSSYPIRIVLPAGREYLCRAETTWTWEPILTKDIIKHFLLRSADSVLIKDDPFWKPIDN